MKSEKCFIILKFLKNLIFSYLLLLFGINLHFDVTDFESNVYISYMTSLVHDFDLNIYNNIWENMKWLVSSTYNFPDMHDYGSSILWSIFYAPIHLIDKIFNIGSLRLIGSTQEIPIDIVSVFIVSIFIGLVTLQMLKYYFKKSFKVLIPNWVLLVLVFSTGFFNFWANEFMSADLTALFYLVTLLIFLLNLKNFKNFQDFFLLGIFFYFGRYIKITFVLTIIFVIYSYINQREDWKRNCFKDAAAFILGAFLIQLLGSVNNFYKFGFYYPTQGYSYAYSLIYVKEFQTWIRTFFGPAGIFYLTPIIFWTFLLFLITLFKKIRPDKEQQNKDLYNFFLISFLPIIFKFALDTFCIGDASTGFGARHYLIDSVAILTGLVIILNPKELNKKQFSIVLICTIWSSVHYLWWLQADGAVPPIFNDQYIQNLSFIPEQISLLGSNFLKLCFGIFGEFFSHIKYLLVLTPVVFLHQWFDPEKISLRINFRRASCLVLFIFTFTTVLNATYNKKNVEIAKENGDYKKTLVGNGIHIYLYEEFISACLFTMELEKRNGNLEHYQMRKQILLNYLKAIDGEILYDPIGFREKIKEGRLPEVGIYEVKLDPSFILDH